LASIRLEQSNSSGVSRHVVRPSFARLRDFRPAKNQLWYAYTRQKKTQYLRETKFMFDCLKFGAYPLGGPRNVQPRTSFRSRSKCIHCCARCLDSRTNTPPSYQFATTSKLKQVIGGVCRVGECEQPARGKRQWVKGSEQTKRNEGYTVSLTTVQNVLRILKVCTEQMLMREDGSDVLLATRANMCRSTVNNRIEPVLVAGLQTVLPKTQRH
jgi:hypothetical protein